MVSVVRIPKILNFISTEYPLWNIYCDGHWATTGCTYTGDINHECSFTGSTVTTSLAKFSVRNNEMICKSLVSHPRDGRELHYSRRGLFLTSYACLRLAQLTLSALSRRAPITDTWNNLWRRRIVKLANGRSDFIHSQRWGMSGHPCESLPIRWLCCTLKLTDGIKQKRHHFQSNGQPKFPKQAYLECIPSKYCLRCKRRSWTVKWCFSFSRGRMLTESRPKNKNNQDGSNDGPDRETY